MAWGARNLISTQVLLGAGAAGRAVPRALPALRERARGAVLPLLNVGVRFSFELTKCVVVSRVFGDRARCGTEPSGVGLGGVLALPGPARGFLRGIAAVGTTLAFAERRPNTREHQAKPNSIAQAWSQTTNASVSRTASKTRKTRPGVAARRLARDR